MEKIDEAIAEQILEEKKFREEVVRSGAEVLAPYVAQQQRLQNTPKSAQEIHEQVQSILRLVEKILAAFGINVQLTGEQVKPHHQKIATDMIERAYQQAHQQEVEVAKGKTPELSEAVNEQRKFLPGEEMSEEKKAEVASKISLPEFKEEEVKAEAQAQFEASEAEAESLKAGEEMIHAKGEAAEGDLKKGASPEVKEAEAASKASESAQKVSAADVLRNRASLSQFKAQQGGSGHAKGEQVGKGR